MNENEVILATGNLEHQINISSLIIFVRFVRFNFSELPSKGYYTKYIYMRSTILLSLLLLKGKAQYL
jgi:hypothetical protein